MSDQVLTAMLSARQNVAATAAQAAPQPIAQPAPAAPQFAPAYEAAAPVYAQPAPVYAYPAPSYGYYNSWPYYWGYPSLSLGFGFGGGYYYGGYRGGGYYGGGYYGGGGNHGGGGGGHH